jgi:hypothetical protein
MESHFIPVAAHNPEESVEGLRIGDKLTNA